MWLSWAEINKRAENLATVFFGAGEWMEKSINYLTKPASYVVDNNKYEQGRMESGLTIFNPAALIDAKVFVIITTTGFEDVVKQLKSYGLTAGLDFCISPALRNFKTITRIKEHKQSILFTCSDAPRPDVPKSGGGLYRLDIPSGNYEKIINGLCHGITRGPNGFFLVDDESHGVLELDPTLEIIGKFSLDVERARPHGIAYYPKRNLVYVSLSSRDTIGVYSAGTYDKVTVIKTSNKYDYYKTPQHHLNDLYIYNDSLFVSMFSLTGNWKRGIYDGVILDIDLNVGEVLGPVVSNLWMPHSPIILDNSLCYCDSMRGKVYCGTERLLTQFNGFVRGIAWDGYFYYIGQSTHRYIDRCQGLSNNISLDSGIFMVDPKSKATKFYALPQLVDINTVFIQ